MSDHDTSGLLRGRLSLLALRGVRKKVGGFWGGALLSLMSVGGRLEEFEDIAKRLKRNTLMVSKVWSACAGMGVIRWGKRRTLWLGATSQGSPILP